MNRFLLIVAFAFVGLTTPALAEVDRFDFGAEQLLVPEVKVPDQLVKPQPETDEQVAPPPVGFEPAPEEVPADVPPVVAEPVPPAVVEPTVQIDIDVSRQHLTVTVDGALAYDWPVSTARDGYTTPLGTFTPTSMNKMWYSKQYDYAPMPNSIFFTKDGSAIHGTNAPLNSLGRTGSHGCVRLAPKNAATLFALVSERGMPATQIVIHGQAPPELNPPAVADDQYQYPPYGRDRRYGDDERRYAPFGYGYDDRRPRYDERRYGYEEPTYERPRRRANKIERFERKLRHIERLFRHPLGVPF